MTPNDRPAFIAALSRTFATYGKPLPDPEVLGVWCTTLEPYPVEAIARALALHVAECRFAPVPADVTTRLPKRGDGRLEAPEAWAIARLGRDESETVCWTQEMAEALSVTNGIENDEFAARTAFTARYNRLVEDARATGKPAVWFMSYGHDASKREGAALEAVRTGRLQLEQARKVCPMLEAPEMPDTKSAQEQRAELARLVATIPNRAEEHMKAREAEAAAERELTDAAKRATAQRVDEYRKRA